MKQPGNALTEQKRQKRLRFQILLLSVAILVICLAWRLSMHNTYTLRINEEYMLPQGQLEVLPEGSDLVEFGKPEPHGEFMEVELHPRDSGEAAYYLTNPATDRTLYRNFRITPLGTIYDPETGGFTGDQIVLFAVTVFFLLLSFLLTRYFLQSREEAMYSYYTVYTSGFALFAGMTGLLLLFLLVAHYFLPGRFEMRTVMEWISAAGMNFMIVTSPMVLVFSVLMIISNIALLRHENPRLQNVLGIIAAVIMLLGDVIGFAIAAGEYARPHDYSFFQETAENVYCTAYVYFECMLAGAIISALRAVRHNPTPDRDYIIILGCRFRKDGTLTPLLKGRCDRAIEFWEDQKKQTGKVGIFMPSGGQGTDETMSEAEAMRRYLVSTGVPDALIRKEDRARNTFQNMAFSKELIEAEKPGARVVFSTTNYHIFRSGVYAGLAGLRAEGIGSKTKWWFWPNAFLRECIGLMVNKFAQELILLLVVAGFFAAMSMVFHV